MRKLSKRPVLPGAAVTCLNMASDGNYMAIGYADGIVELMRCSNLSVDQTVLAHSATPDDGGVASVAFSPDRSKLATCGGDRLVNVFSVFYVGTSPRSRQLHGKVRDAPAPPRPAPFPPHGTRLIFPRDSCSPLHQPNMRAGLDA